MSPAQRKTTDVKNKPSNRINQELFDGLVELAKKINTSTRFMDFPSEKRMAEWPSDASAYAQELEEIVAKLSLESDVILLKILASRGGQA